MDSERSDKETKETQGYRNLTVKKRNNPNFFHW